jgi:hypothetical protein
MEQALGAGKPGLNEPYRALGALIVPKTHTANAAKTLYNKIGNTSCNQDLLQNEGPPNREKMHYLARL